MAALHLNDAGTWRQVQNVYVNDAGTWRQIRVIYVNDAGTWRQVYNYRAPESGRITAGQNGTGGAYGYVKSSYGSITGWPGTGGLLSDVREITALRDTNPTTVGGDGLLRIAGFSSDPGIGYFSSITANSLTKLSADASYSYSSGVAIWQWIGSPFNFLAGNTYNPITINF